MKGNLNIDNRSGVFHRDDKTARTENYNCVRERKPDCGDGMCNAVDPADAYGAYLSELFCT